MNLIVFTCKVLLTEMARQIIVETHAKDNKVNCSSISTIVISVRARWTTPPGRDTPLRNPHPPSHEQTPDSEQHGNFNLAERHHLVAIWQDITGMKRFTPRRDCKLRHFHGRRVRLFSATMVQIPRVQSSRRAVVEGGYSAAGGCNLVNLPSGSILICRGEHRV